MRVLSLLSYTGLASALVAPCLPQLGPEFCPSSQVLSDNNDTLYEAFRNEHPAIFPNSTTQVSSISITILLRVSGIASHFLGNVQFPPPPFGENLSYE